MRRVMGFVGAGVIALAVAAPVAASAPERDAFTFTTDAYVIADCDGYDVMEQLTGRVVVVDFVGPGGDVIREVVHSSTTGLDWRSDTGAQLATFSDVGGTFTAAANGTFTWTGIHSQWKLADGTVVKFVGRVVVAEVEPGVFERVFGAGSYSDFDPCTW